MSKEDRKQVTGTVAAISEKTFGGKKNVSFRLREDENQWYRAGGKRYAGVLEKGNLVQVTYEINQNGQYTNYDVTDLRAVQPEKGDDAAPQQTNAKSQGGYDGTYNRQTHPVDMRRISYAAARTAAIEFVQLLLSAEAVAIGTQTKKRLDVVESLLDKYTEQFYHDSVTEPFGALARNAEGAASEETKEEVGSDD